MYLPKIKYLLEYIFGCSRLGWFEFELRGCMLVVMYRAVFMSTPYPHKFSISKGATVRRAYVIVSVEIRQRTYRSRASHRSGRRSAQNAIGVDKNIQNSAALRSDGGPYQIGLGTNYVYIKYIQEIPVKRRKIGLLCRIQLIHLTLETITQIDGNNKNKKYTK